MNEMFESLGIGLGGGGVRDLRAADGLLPVAPAGPDLHQRRAGVIAGIVTVLYFTGTSLNIESFMGSIMCLGVSVSNSVMLVTFMDEHWKAGDGSDPTPP